MNAPIVISVGGGPNQFPLIEAARNLGCDLVVVDRAPSDECLAIGCEIVECSTFESDEVIARLETTLFDRRPSALLNRTSGPAILTAGRICERFSIESLSPRLAISSYQKSQLAQDCCALGITTPLTEVFCNFPTEKMWGGIVLKPNAPLYGKLNVYLPQDRAQAEEAFVMAQQESFDGNVNVQAYIRGIDVTLMTISAHRKCVFTLPFEELVDLEDGHFKGVGVRIPSLLSESVLRRINEAARRMLRFWSVRSGFVFFSFRVDADGKPWLYEVNPGLCGDDVAGGLLPAALGVSYEELCRLDAELSLGGVVEVKWRVNQSVSVTHGKIRIVDQKIS